MGVRLARPRPTVTLYASVGANVRCAGRNSRSPRLRQRPRFVSMEPLSLYCEFRQALPELESAVIAFSNSAFNCDTP